MLELAANAVASPVDPLIALLIGALGAALLGLFGAWIQGRREHSRWLREQRLEAYVAYMRWADRVLVAPQRDGKFDLGNEMVNMAADVRAAAQLLGPNAVAGAIDTHFKAVLVQGKAHVQHDKEGATAAAITVSDAEDVLLRAARKALGIPLHFGA